KAGLGSNARFERGEILEQGSLIGTAERQTLVIEPRQITAERMTLVVTDLNIAPSVNPRLSRERGPIPDRQGLRQGTHASSLRLLARRWRPRGRALSMMPSRRAAAHLVLSST